MEDVKKIPQRSEIAVEDTWATEDMYATDEAWEADLALLVQAKDEIAGISLAIAGKVVGRELSADDQKSLIDSFINELGDQV